MLKLCVSNGLLIGLHKAVFFKCFCLSALKKSFTQSNPYKHCMLLQQAYNATEAAIREAAIEAKVAKLQQQRTVTTAAASVTIATTTAASAAASAAVSAMASQAVGALATMGADVGLNQLASSTGIDKLINSIQIFTMMGAYLILGPPFVLCCYLLF